MFLHNFRQTQLDKAMQTARENQNQPETLKFEIPVADYFRSRSSRGWDPSALILNAVAIWSEWSIPCRHKFPVDESGREKPFLGVCRSDKGVSHLSRGRPWLTGLVCFDELGQKTCGMYGERDMGICRLGLHLNKHCLKLMKKLFRRS